MKFLVFITTVDLLLTFLTFLYYRLVFRECRGSFFAVLYFLFSSSIIVSRILPDVYPMEFLGMFAYVADFWLGFLYYSLLVAFVHLCIYTAFWFLNVRLPGRIIGLVLIVISLGIYGYGCWQGFQPKLRREYIATEKLEPGRKLRIALISDVHLGMVLGRDFATSVVNRINEEKPDVVIVAGDMADGKLSYILRGNSLEPFAGLQSSYGTYMVMGNHDYIDNPKRWQRILKLYKIKVLHGSSTTIMNGKVKITGLIDFSRDGGTEALRQLAVGNNDFFSILVDHQPRRMAAAEEEGYNLYVSGHTHGGQIFPNRIFTCWIYELDYGRRDMGKMTCIVSSGVGFWGPPARSGVASEMVIIDVEGKAADK